MQPGDELMWVERCVADDSVLLASSDGTVIRFPTSQVGLNSIPLLVPRSERALCV